MLAAAAVMIVLLTAVTGYAFGDVEFLSVKTLDYEGFYSVITDTEGTEHRLSGVIDADRLEESAAFPKIGSYKIYFGDEEVIEVRLNNIKQTESKSDNRLPLLTSSGASLSAGGYYSVEFRLNDTAEYAFITGLTKNNVENVQNKLFGAKLENLKFSITDADFIDTEKTGTKDSLMCWAASTADMLEYSGWAKKAEEVNPNVADKFLNEDTIFDLFVENFNDKGGNQYYGLQWFFNGYYAVQKATGQNWSAVNNYGESGGFLKDYAYSDVTSAVNVEKHEDISETLSALKDGNAVGVSVSWMKNGAGNGGHAITMWGYIYDKAEPSDSFDYMKALIVTDSDSDRTQNSDRTQAPNKMHILNMKKYNRSGYDTWEFDGYGGDTNVGVLVGFTLLKPYNDSVPHEINDKATKDMTKSSDLYIKDFSLSVNELCGENYNVKKKEVRSDDILYIKSSVGNSGQTYTDKISCYIRIKNCDTNSYIKLDGGSDELYIAENARITLADGGYCKLSYPLELLNYSLTEGNYTLEIETESADSISEAYYYNNTYSFDFICKAGAGTEASKAWITEESRYDNGRLTAVTITVENPSGADRLNIHPFIAIYGEDRRLIELKDVGVKTLEKYTGAENDGSTVTERFELPENASYKVFLWDAENIMRPIKYIKW